MFNFPPQGKATNSTRDWTEQETLLLLEVSVTRPGRERNKCFLSVVTLFSPNVILRFLFISLFLLPSSYLDKKFYFLKANIPSTDPVIFYGV